MQNSVQLSHRAALRSSHNPLQRAFSALEVYRQRRALQRLDAHLLKDLGLSREDVAVESRKSLWSDV
ncbi:DUF1127 domain-containing protein [Actibacterium pelagium]|uniref:YjiS-like domain-containing protein n=1 Tax=Actibacterium pelagium TaxID=2029103 RepID=A0A917AF32_9RHOB|nr:DUF1127 domain-containing protein [Actibacterium pelagium]GGE43911.1 hypothetical protein GCM10011517_09500 [Actibacterium pelagium]